MNSRDEWLCPCCREKVYFPYGYTIRADKNYYICETCFREWVKRYHDKGLQDSKLEGEEWQKLFNKTFKQFLKEKRKEVMILDVFT